MSGRIDTHIHALPPAYLSAVNAAGGDPSGFPSPEWSLDDALKLMDNISTSIGILSVSAPGASIAGSGEDGRKLAHTLNNDLADQISKSSAGRRLGFFGILPDWQDVDGTVSEIEFLYQQQKLCHGVTVFTSYGGKLLGDPVFKPIWEKLQAHKALVFLHPTGLDVTPKLIASALPQPIVDYPLATTRAAVDLVLTGTLHSCPDVDVILSHAGGTLPFLATRVLGTLNIPALANVVAVGYETAQADFARFYYDTALSSGPTQLGGLLDFADPSHILFGSDFPYCPDPLIELQVLLYEGFVASHPRGSIVAPEVLRGNSMTLLKKHSQGADPNWDFEVKKMMHESKM
ncbi:uncharacterized protein BDZ83DRAFT_587443 [Colletotrichum acutatum]|uniref:6-methylsalicylate decarboxylase n=1 Tax=Glomerella acutata TaxID=27357 RepID=A0AAD8XBU7_GLOAC|nr:uncharacterized protein BDZ83DRAFT_587443 [Colletotrichum acutatum]KAK1716172.1 hypothetical protein BDZ83DRAFT_587443 [Colletotrichum acutatum]